MAMRKWMVAAAGSWLLAALSASGTHAACEPLFPGIVLPVGGEIVTGDFDGDGAIDLAEGRSTTVRVALNRGAYRFEVTQTWNTLGAGIACGDVDGDGDLDLVAGSARDAADAVSILRNDGLGNFEVTAIHEIDGGAEWLALGDLTGDGLPDIVTTAANGQLCTLINQGGGDFEIGSYFDADYQVSDIVIADLDGNGVDDILVATWWYQVDDGRHDGLVFLNLGDGAFAEPIEVGSGGEYSNGIAAADFDRDGDLDLALGSGWPRTLVFRNEGDATLSEPEVYESVGYGLETADVNNDGYPDLISSGWGGDEGPDGVTILLNTNSGASFSAQTIPITGAQKLVARDMNCDGYVDLLVGTRRDWPIETQLLLNDGAGEFLAPHTIETDPMVQQRLAAGDLNGDGLADLVAVGSQDGVVTVRLSDAGGGFTTHNTYPTEPYSWGIQVIDLNGDESLDVLLLDHGWDDAEARILALLNDGEGGLTPGEPSELDSIIVDDFAVADLNDDGLPDVFATVGDWWLDEDIFLRNLGDGTFAQHGSMVLTEGHRSPQLADVDGDGKADLVLLTRQYTGSALVVYRRVGPFEFEDPLYYERISNMSELRLADLDADGDLDAFMATYHSYSQNSIEIAYNDGTGMFGSSQETPVEEPLAMSCLVDLDDDGLLDLLAAEEYSKLRVALATGPGEFGPPQYLNTVYLNSFVAADFDGDGRIDIAASSEDHDSLQWTEILILLNKHRPPCIGDLNGDCDANQRDLGLLLKSFERDPGGDLDGDGDTDAADLGILLDNYGCN
jgi:FG-GAP-like repeat